MTSVLLWGGESVFAEELRSAISEAGDFSVMACSCEEQMGNCLARHRPDIILLDTPAEPAPNLVMRLQCLTPVSRVVLWMRSVPLEFDLKMVALGVRGAVLRSASTGTVARCLASVSEGELWFDRSLPLAQSYSDQAPSGVRPWLYPSGSSD